MRILMAVPHTLPSPEGGHGCPVMSWAMLRWLKEAGHDVSLFGFAPTSDSREPGRAEARRHIQALGVPLIESEMSGRQQVTQWQLRMLTARKLVAPRFSDYLAESASYKPQWMRAVEQTKPDAFWLYTTDAVAVSHKTFPNIPRLASLIDLDHEAKALKRSLRPGTIRNRIRNLAEELQDRSLPAALVDYLKGCHAVVEHSVESARWLNTQGIPAQYLPNPVEAAPLPPDWFHQRESMLAAAPAKRILMVGYLRGIATQTGLHLLADEVLPELIRTSDGSPWEVHIVGGGELTPELKAKLAGHPNVRLRGFVKDLAAEYQQAHLNLVTVSEKIGFRTRLVEAFGYGSPSVVHANNRYGMPELGNDQNCLLAESGAGLAQSIRRVLADESLRHRLESSARKTYESELSAPVVMSRMFALLEKHLQPTQAVHAA